MEASTGASGPAAAEVVWERYAQPRRWPGWAPQIRRVETAAARIAPGVTGTVRGPFGLPVRFVVTAVDEVARRWAWDARVGPVRLHLRHGVDRDGPGTRTWLTARGPAPVLMAYLPLARFALHRLVR
ncbi:SRPBCC family protein [Pseudonocardia lacus]|uniref:SRPBCC family protein n=1 Tax=Pseudonocardia lacus TaxID=2835865 RepID=UPI001BDCB675|nr:SRPBCC family protein [Pseudonocardia lacus]